MRKFNLSRDVGKSINNLSLKPRIQLVVLGDNMEFRAINFIPKDTRETIEEYSEQ